MRGVVSGQAWHNMQAGRQAVGKGKRAQTEREEGGNSSVFVVVVAVVAGGRVLDLPPLDATRSSAEGLTRLAGWSSGADETRT